MVEGGHLGRFKYRQEEKMGSEALDLFVMHGEGEGQRIARIDRVGKGQKKIELFSQFDGIHFEMLVLTALSAWAIHKKLDGAILKGIGELLFST